MYVTAHMVRDAGGKEAIHGFLHEHGDVDWPGDVSRWPEENPGRLALQRTVLPMGGNAVRSYLDVLAPDSVPASDLDAALDHLREDLLERVNPTLMRHETVTLRFGVEFFLESERMARYDELAHVVRELLQGRES